MVKISFLFVSRNDQYCGDSPLRLFTSLKCLSHQIIRASFKDSCEIILVDWNSSVPLIEHEYFQERLPVPIHYVNVRQETVKKAGITVPVSEVHAFNLAVRAASGEYVIRLDQDLLISQRVIEFLKSDLLKPNELLWCSRRESHPTHMSSVIPAGYTARSREAWYDLLRDPAKFVNLNYHNLPLWNNRVYDNGEGAVGLFGMHRSVWIHTLGYNEQMTGWGHMEIEFGKRLESVPGLVWRNLSETLDCAIVHIWHPEHRSATPREINHMDGSLQFRQSIDTFGMGEYLNEIARFRI